MEFISDYIYDGEKRAMLNDLTRRTFRFDFEDWVSGGYYTGEYIPYSLAEDGRLLSNVSANIMRFLQDGALTLSSVVSERYVPLEQVIAHIGGEYGALTLGFAPLRQDEGLFSAEPYDGADDYRLFYCGGRLRSIERDRLFFPLLSHA